MASRAHGSLDERWSKLLAQRGRSALLSGARGAAHKPRALIVPEVAPQPDEAADLACMKIRKDHDRAGFDSLDALSGLAFDHIFFQALVPSNAQALRELLRKLLTLMEGAYMRVNADGNDHAQTESKIQAMASLQSFLGAKLNHIFALLNLGACLDRQHA